MGGENPVWCWQQHTVATGITKTVIPVNEGYAITNYFVIVCFVACYAHSISLLHNEAGSWLPVAQSCCTKRNEGKS